MPIYLQSTAEAIRKYQEESLEDSSRHLLRNDPHLEDLDKIAAAISSDIHDKHQDIICHYCSAYEPPPIIRYKIIINVYLKMDNSPHNLAHFDKILTIELGSSTLKYDVCKDGYDMYPSQTIWPLYDPQSLTSLHNTLHSILP